MKNGAEATPEIWAGVECSLNRLNDSHFCQLERSGHDTRLEDVELFATLGVRTVRFPILWERTAPHPHGPFQWEWAQARLTKLQELGIRPIAGLVHHGSGPLHTDLLDPEFPEKLESYARSVALRFPWLDAYTPVNEPLTTARFSGLYGLWYPHGRDGRSFMRCLLNQCRGTALAMAAVREVNPTALLVQTEDLGRIYSTPRLAYQAEFENERRWLSFDLLCGRVTPWHPLWKYITKELAIHEDELLFFVENPCPPDIFGINHYVTSDRFLDERLGLHPSWTHGGNGRHCYADTEAVRVLPPDDKRFSRVIHECWERYRSPLALTEVHLGCTREEQLRWFEEAWNAACAERRAGIDVRAITAWSFLGSFDWSSLLTHFRGHYESGVFDVRGGAPRPTALAGLVAHHTLGKPFPLCHILEEKGWWQRPHPQPGRIVQEEPHVSWGSSRPIAITGGTGTLGRAFARICELRGLAYRLLTRQECDIASPESVEKVLAELRPWAFVNAAGYVHVDEAEGDQERCWRENTQGPALLAVTCARHGVRLLTFSSDLVFDGRNSVPYLETDGVSPLSVYGQSKARAEALVLAHLPSALVVRTGAFFGPWDQHNFVTKSLGHLRLQGHRLAVGPATVSPTYIPDLVNASLDLFLDGEQGIVHLANRGAVSWADLARLAARCAGMAEVDVFEADESEVGWKAPRPRYSVLGSRAGHLLPELEDALDRFVFETGLHTRAS